MIDPLGDNTGELIAVKKLQPNKQSNLEDFQKEINTIRSLHCDYIVKYRGVCYSMGKNMQINSYTKTPITLFVGYNATRLSAAAPQLIAWEMYLFYEVSLDKLIFEICWGFWYPFRQCQ